LNADKAKLLEMLVRNIEKSLKPFDHGAGDDILHRAVMPKECVDYSGYVTEAPERPRLDAIVVHHLLGLTMGTRFSKHMTNVVENGWKCQSPIEELLFFSLLLAGEAMSDIPVLIGMEPGYFAAPTAIQLEAQPPVGDYHPDFRVTAYTWHPFSNSGGWRRGAVLVECDGHDFHERTKEQASRDKKRDRDLQSLGFPVFRYTGSDVWKNSMGVAREIILAAYGIAEKSEPMNPPRVSQ
jgi:hypothetical protein